MAPNVEKHNKDRYAPHDADGQPSLEDRIDLGMARTNAFDRTIGQIKANA